MILEIATLNVRPGQAEAFEEALGRARAIIEASPGFARLELRRCVESSNRYVLFVTWNSVEDHTVRFRESEPYQKWRAALHHFYEQPPTVEHYNKPVKW
jgi:heme-degrading monooxygenase HmoA